MGFLRSSLAVRENPGSGCPGRFFTSVEGLTVAYPTGNPPYGLTYTSPESPRFDQPFIRALTGRQYIQQFPVHVPKYGTSPKNPDSTVDWSRYGPISGAGTPFYKNKTPYSMTLNLTLERQIGPGMVASVSYIGALGRHLMTIVAANPGRPDVCLSLSRPADVAPGTPTCGPFGENQVYTRANGVVVNAGREHRSPTRSARMATTPPWATHIIMAWSLR